jgi:hypothetical protein
VTLVDQYGVPVGVLTDNTLTLTDNQKGQALSNLGLASRVRLLAGTSGLGLYPRPVGVMASPPTITAGQTATSFGAGFFIPAGSGNSTNQYGANTNSHYSYARGAPAAQTFNQKGVSANNITLDYVPNYGGTSLQVSFFHDGQVLEIAQGSYGGFYLLKVDGQYVSLTPTATGSTGNTVFDKYDFGSVGRRRIDIIGSGMSGVFQRPTDLPFLYPGQGYGVDYWPVLADRAATTLGWGKTAYLEQDSVGVGGVHNMSVAGYQMYGKALPVFQGLGLPPQPSAIHQPGEVYDATNNPRGNLLTNGDILGGTAISGTTGGVTLAGVRPTNHTVTSNGALQGSGTGITITGSQVTGTATGDWYQIRRGLPTATSTPYFSHQLNPTMLANCVVGDVLIRPVNSRSVAARQTCAVCRSASRAHLPVGPTRSR